MLEKTFESSNYEQDIYKKWEQGGYFKPSGRGDNFSVVIPPPNVTGNLHMGHALNNTMQDIIVRYKRLKGNNTLWLPGTDHAGIATQMVVERLLEADKINRHDLGREKFLNKVWEWKEHSGGQIVHQQRRLGNSTDWTRERFTMDEGLSKAVLKVFVQLYEEGLIYRDKRLVNWDPKLETAISDLEVNQEEIMGHMWYFKYPIVNEKDSFITVGTTRPETMLGDTGVAVHPSDERYKSLIGKQCIQPLTGKQIPIVADDYPDPEQGTGAVKITPAHDFNDFEVGKRQNLEVINIMTKDGKMNQNCPEKYIGIDRFEARKIVINDMEEAGYLVKIEEHTHTVPYGDRGGVAIEPYLTDQWYVDAQKLAKPALEAVKDGRTKIVPENWTKTYYEWMNNIQPWCISRQLWWGHQIPAWFHQDGTIFVAESEEEAYSQAKQKYGEAVKLTRDSDVLDTWFSSALWPFSTLGWPDKTTDLEQFYQNDILVTGFDILFFWVARMMMMGIHFMGAEPFHTVIVHALVLDEHGAKMSKTKGNVIDPIIMADEYGSDTLRFTLASLATPGKDIKFSPSRLEGTKSLMTKIWNGAKFCEMNAAYTTSDFDIATPKHPINLWIIAELNNAVKDFEKAIENYRFSECASVVYQFVRAIFCDWYVEFSKPLYWSKDEELLLETRQTMGYVFKNILKLLHPIAPFLSEKLWEEFGEKGKMLISADWIEIDENKINNNAQKEIDWVRRFISSVRSTRGEMNVPAGSEITVKLLGIKAEKWQYLNNNLELIKKLAKINIVEKTENSLNGVGQFIIDEATVFIPFDGAVDITAEILRLEKILKKAESDMKKFAGKLSSEGYLAQAPQHIIEKDKTSLNEAENIVEKTKTAIQKLKG